MTTLSLKVLGDVQVLLDQIPVTRWRTDKALALLIYLALERRPHRRSALAALLWPGYSPESAANSLRVALHQLRLVIGDQRATPPWLLVTRQQIELNRAAAIQLDATTFTTLLDECRTHAHVRLVDCNDCLARLRQAAALYQDDFLADFGLADSSAFEEWRRTTQEQFHVQALDLFDQLSTIAAATGHEEEAYTYTLRKLALEPWLESAHRQIMRTLARQGQRAAAIAQYNTCRQVLAEELGTEPDGETQALVAEIRSGRFDKQTKGEVEGRRSGQQEGKRAGEERPLSVIPARPRATAPLHNLPVQLTAFVGRERMLVEISSRLQQGSRLITLVGPGGMGKTRLAVEVGYQQLPNYADGLFLVELATISVSAAVTGTLAGAIATAVAAAVGLPAQANEPHVALWQFLRQKQLLLILDNFEHLLCEPAAGIELLTEWLQAAPGVQILVTSREQLNLRGEQIYRVQPLDFSAKGSLAETADMPAVQLFLQTAQRVEATFELTEANLEAVLRICRLVQGMPLGLELAAAQVAMLPLTTIANEIEQSAVSLGVNWHDLPERQRSIGAVFAWSWQLLSQTEQQVLRQLAIFHGGFDRAAADAVAGASPAVLTRLIQKSLLQWQAMQEGDGRYLLHELLRQFATAQLTAAGEAEPVANRHSSYYLGLAAAQTALITRNAPREAAQAIQRELDNIRQAWRWGAGQADATTVEQSALALREFYWISGLTAEGIAMFALAAEARCASIPADQPPVKNEHQKTEQRLCSILLGLHANFLIMVGQHEEALRQATAALQLAQSSGAPEGTALALLVQGQALRRQGESARARLLLSQSVQIAQQLDNNRLNGALLLDIEYRAQSWLCSIALSNDDYTAARAHTIRQLALCRQLQAVVGEAMALTSLVDIDKTIGAFAPAQQNAEAALAVARKEHFRWGEAACLRDLGEIAWAQGDYSQAKALYEQAVRLFNDSGRPLEETTVAHALGRLLLRLGDVEEARIWIDHTFRLLQSMGMPARETFWATLSRGWWYLLTGDLLQALVDAETGWQMAQQLDGGTSQAHALVLLGLVREELHQPAAATAAFQEALTIYATLGHHHHTAEPRAGLARLALADGDRIGAIAVTEETLAVLHDHPLAGYDEPFQVYLTCYRVLAAAADPRAMTIVNTAHALLVTYAERIVDQAERRTFLENVTSHRALQQAFVDIQIADLASLLLPV